LDSIHLVDTESTQKLAWKITAKDPLLLVGIRNHPPRWKRRGGVCTKKYSVTRENGCRSKMYEKAEQRPSQAKSPVGVETETLKSLFYRIPTAEIAKPRTQNPLFNIYIIFLVIIKKKFFFFFLTFKLIVGW